MTDDELERRVYIEPTNCAALTELAGRNIAMADDAEESRKELKAEHADEIAQLESDIEELKEEQARELDAKADELADTERQLDDMRALFIEADNRARELAAAGLDLI
ncbi:MAG: hypothetical protein ACRYGK_01620 [Janthinobacterium lividum]